jgi:hypothetical protein
LQNTPEALLKKIIGNVSCSADEGYFLTVIINTTFLNIFCHCKKKCKKKDILQHCQLPSIKFTLSEHLSRPMTSVYLSGKFTHKHDNKTKEACLQHAIISYNAKDQ